MSSLSNLLKTKKAAVGLDIGGSSVKLVEMAKAGDGFRLTRCGAQPVANSFSEDGNSIGTDRAAVVQAIRDLFANNKISTRHVISAVSGESVIVRIIRMPWIDQNKKGELEFAVRNEARDFIPFEMEDVVFDYQRLGEMNIDGQRSMEILIVAVKKELIQDHIALLNEAGLEPVVIDVGSFALVNALNAANKVTGTDAVALVNIGADVTSIAVMRESMTRFTRDFATAGRNITNALVADLGISWEQAEALKIQHGIYREQDDVAGAEAQAEESQTASMQMVHDINQAIDEISGSGGAPEGEPETNLSWRVSEVCKQVVGDIASEVKRSLLYYENQLDGEAVTKIILSGGTARLRNVADYFEHLLDVPTECCQLLDQFDNNVSVEESGDRSPVFGIGVGLALRNVI